MPFEIGDLVVPVQKIRRRRTAPPRIGVIIDIDRNSKYGIFYTVHFLRADCATVGWEEYALQHYIDGVESAA